MHQTNKIATFNNYSVADLHSSVEFHGGVITWKNEAEELRAVKFWSEKRRHILKHKSSVYVELEEIVKLCRKFKYYILGRTSVIHTKHIGLIKLIHNNCDLTFSQWLFRLMPHRLIFCYIPGYYNTMADLISQQFSTIALKDREKSVDKLKFVNNEKFKLANFEKVEAVSTETEIQTYQEFTINSINLLNKDIEISSYTEIIITNNNIQPYGNLSRFFTTNN
uniref:RT_RNaseH_2 domain-containing protein n=1 Tax=Strongyloides stercoralis TaxID=6248 RepID=A0AAF5DIG3_STRER